MRSKREPVGKGESVNREVTIRFRTDREGKELLSGIARRMDRSASDALRVLVKRTAAELGVTATPQNDRKSETSGQLQAA